MAATREAMVDIGGKSFMMVSDDEYLDHIHQGFEPDMVRLFRTLVASSDIVLDIGTNIGCTAILFGDLAKVFMRSSLRQLRLHFLKKMLQTQPCGIFFRRTLA
jgi:hypothetical protein